VKLISRTSGSLFVLKELEAFLGLSAEPSGQLKTSLQTGDSGEKRVKRSVHPFGRAQTSELLTEFLKVNEVEMIMRAIMDTHPGLSMDDQILLAGKAYRGISKIKADIAKGITGTGDEETGSQENIQPGHGYTKADLKENPMSALKGEKATCCLCGKHYDIITSVHLWSKHKITPEQYRELCGYSPDTKLMTDAQLQKKKDILNKAKPWEKTNRWQNNHPEEVVNATDKGSADKNSASTNNAKGAKGKKNDKAPVSLKDVQAAHESRTVQNQESPKPDKAE